MDEVRLFFGAVALSAWVAVWIIAPSIGGNLTQRKTPPTNEQGSKK